MTLSIVPSTRSASRQRADGSSSICHRPHTFLAAVDVQRIQPTRQLYRMEQGAWTAELKDWKSDIREGSTRAIAVLCC